MKAPGRSEFPAFLTKRCSLDLTAKITGAMRRNGRELTTGGIGDVVMRSVPSLGRLMTVTVLVLGAALLSIFGLLASFIPQRRVPALDESSIHTATQLDAAISIQRAVRVAALQRRMTDSNYLSYLLLGLAFLMQMAALAADHLAHLSIAVICIVPAFFTVLAARASRRRYARRQLDAYLRSQPSLTVSI